MYDVCYFFFLRRLSHRESQPGPAVLQLELRQAVEPAALARRHQAAHRGPDRQGGGAGRGLAAQCAAPPVIQC